MTVVHAMWFVRIASFSVIWLTLTGAILYVLTGWYVDALLRVASARSVLMRTICGTALYLALSFLMFAPLAGYLFMRRLGPGINCD
jgi:hypothetical protein